MYTLCHRRTKGTYSISLCKPDSSWVKYRHQGLAYRQVCHIRSYRDLYTRSAQIRVRLCAEKLLNASVCAQINPVSSSAIERRNNCYNGRLAVSWQRRVPQWCNHWFLPEVSNLFLKSWEMYDQRRSSVESMLLFDWKPGTSSTNLLLLLWQSVATSSAVSSSSSWRGGTMPGKAALRTCKSWQQKRTNLKYSTLNSV